MKKRVIIIGLLIISTTLLLAACEATSEDRPDVNEKIIFVGPQLVDCEGVAPQQCMLVKEDPQAEYTLYYDSIDGFDYEEGYEYELRIREETVENPPADASSIKWTLIEEVSKTPVGTDETAALTPTEEAEIASGGEVITMRVGPEQVDCEGVGPQTCLQVKTNPEDDYTLFYNQVEGFEFEPGYEYELLVLVEPVENPPADGSSLKYTLVEEMSKTPAAGGSTSTEEGSAPSDMTLEGTNWNLVSYVAPDGQAADVLPDSRITAEFKDGQVGGSAGCNRYFGSYETDGSSLTIGPAGSTMMYCSPEEIMLQETAYLATLSSVASYEFVDGQLQLKNANGETILLFTVEEPLSLTSMTWNLISYNNGKQAMVSLIIGTEITADFDKDGLLNGSAGCNSYSGGYETTGNSISIGPLASTEMFCSEPEGIMEQETQYLAALQDAATYQIDGDRLEIRDANGSGVAYYEAAQPTTLIGPTWNLLFHNNGQEAMVSTIIGTDITAVFAEDGTLTGSAGCNSYSASYRVDGENIAIGPAATTRMFCSEPEGIMEQESQYLAALEYASVYTVDGSKLELRDANGAGVASYELVELSAEAGAAAAEIDESTPETPVTSEEVTEAADGDNGTAVSDEITIALRNASYPLDYSGSGTIQLTDGEYRQPAADDSAAEIVTQLTDHYTLGELSSGERIVAAILVSQTGGTGTFYDLVVMSEQNGRLSSPTSAYLGDRVVINGLTIENDQIIVDMVVQGPDDPFCCPTQQVIQMYELQGGELVQVSSEVIGTIESQEEDIPDIVNIVWKWQELIAENEQLTIDSPEKYTVEFKSNGEVSVIADCNIGGGTYEIDSKSISINITSTTLAFCAEGSFGDQFFHSLESASTYVMDGDNLMIELNDDGGTMRFFE